MAAVNFPSSPTNGQTFTSGGKTYTYNGTGWVLGYATPTTASRVSATAPTSPNSGDIWIDSNTMTQYAYYNDGNTSQWVEVSASVKPAITSGTFASRPAASLIGMYYFATDTSRLYLDTGTSWVEVAAGNGSVTNAMLADGIPAKPTYETSLPGSPVDGQEIYYAADATNGVIWHLRYRSGSSSSYKWEFIGGSGLSFHRSDASPPTVTTTTYAGLSTDSITIPLAGDYELSWGAWLAASTNTTRSVLLKPGTSAPSTDDKQALHSNAQDPASAPHSSKTAFFTGFAANSTLKVYGRHNTAGTLTTTVYWLYLIAVPVRLG